MYGWGSANRDITAATARKLPPLRQQIILPALFNTLHPLPSPDTYYICLSPADYLSLSKHPSISRSAVLFQLLCIHTRIVIKLWSRFCKCCCIQILYKYSVELPIVSRPFYVARSHLSTRSTLLLVLYTVYRPLGYPILTLQLAGYGRRLAGTTSCRARASVSHIVPASYKSTLDVETTLFISLSALFGNSTCIRLNNLHLNFFMRHFFLLIKTLIFF